MNENRVMAAVCASGGSGRAGGSIGRTATSSGCGRGGACCWAPGETSMAVARQATAARTNLDIDEF
jgi:hypothetical protein